MFKVRKCEGNILDALRQVEKLCDQSYVIETKREFIHLGDSVSAGGGFEAAVTARTRYGRIKFNVRLVTVWQKISSDSESGYLRSYAKPPIIHRSEARCLKRK